MPPAVPLFLAWLAQHPADFDELRLAIQAGEVVDRPPVGRGHLVVERHYRATLRLEEAEQEVAAWGQHPAELVEVRRYFLGRGMDERVPGHDSAQLTISQAQGVHRTDLETQVRVCLAGKVDHHWRQVDAKDVQSQVPEVRCHLSGAASKLGDGPGAVGLDQLGERGEHRAIQRKMIEAVSGEIGITGGYGVVGRRRSTQIRGRSHTEDPTEYAGLGAVAPAGR